jgi:hypothetical protein
VTAVDDLPARAHRAREFIYGTITVLVAIAGIEVGGGTDAPSAAAIILASAVATAVAHSYAGFVGRRLVEGQPLATRDVIAALRADSPVVLAAIPAVAAAIAAKLGFWSLGTALSIGNVCALIALAAIGWLAARASGGTVARSILSTVISTSIGLGIVIVELLAHH